MGSVMMFMTSCAAFQAKPELQSVTALELFEWIDSKATNAEMNAIDQKANADKLIQVFNATKSELQRRVNNGEIKDIEAFNRLGFGLTTKPAELPSALPDSSKNSRNL